MAQNHRLVVAIGVGSLGVLGLVGCGDTDSRQEATAPPTTAATSATTQPTAAPPGAPAPGQSDTVPMAAAQAALRTAAGAVPNGRPFDVEIEALGNEKVFEVKVASDGKEFKVVVDATGNRVVSQQQTNTPDDDIAKLQGIQVDASQALQAASQQAADATLDEMEIDTNSAGVVVWQVQLVRPDGSEVEYEVDAQNGAVIATR